MVNYNNITNIIIGMQTTTSYINVNSKSTPISIYSIDHG